MLAWHVRAATTEASCGVGSGALGGRWGGPRPTATGAEKQRHARCGGKEKGRHILMSAEVPASVHSPHSGRSHGHRAPERRTAPRASTPGPRYTIGGIRRECHTECRPTTLQHARAVRRSALHTWATRRPLGGQLDCHHPLSRSDRRAGTPGFNDGAQWTGRRPSSSGQHSTAVDRRRERSTFRTKQLKTDARRDADVALNTWPQPRAVWVHG